jgi:hypothetical protein
LIDGIGVCHDSAFLSFASALRVHVDWEKIYIANMDFHKADLLASYTEEMLLGISAEQSARCQGRFFGASTPNGAMHYIENLTAGIAKRYFLKAVRARGSRRCSGSWPRHPQSAGWIRRSIPAPLTQTASICLSGRSLTGASLTAGPAPSASRPGRTTR